MAKKALRQHRYKGKVGVRSFQNFLSLRLPRHLFDGQQKIISLHLPDSPENRQTAEDMAWEIELDVRRGTFDPSLKKYGFSQECTSESKKQLCYTLTSLYEAYIQAHQDMVSPGTLKNGYLVALAHIKRSPFAELAITDIEAVLLYDWAIANLTPDAGRRLMMQLNASFKWAIERTLVPVEQSPFEGFAQKVSKRFRAARPKTEIIPFSPSERDMIIQAFQENKRFKHYSNYVKFLFYTGCRPSEAIALTWANVATDFSWVAFCEVVVAGVNGQHRRNGLKTQKSRTFPCNSQLKEVLCNARSKSTSDIVFPSTKGKTIAVGHFQQKPWKSILSQLPIIYRKPYCMRHTFITLCLESGLNVKDVAKLVGNTPETIYRHYAGAKPSITVPIFK